MDFILRGAVNGSSRSELCDNLIMLAELIREDPSPKDCINACGSSNTFDWDYQIDEKKIGEVVSIRISDDDSATKMVSDSEGRLPLNELSPENKPATDDAGSRLILNKFEKER